MRCLFLNHASFRHTALTDRLHHGAGRDARAPPGSHPRFHKSPGSRRHGCASHSSYRSACGNRADVGSASARGATRSPGHEPRPRAALNPSQRRVRAGRYTRALHSRSARYSASGRYWSGCRRARFSHATSVASSTRSMSSS